jgi:hypothetical protein
MLADDTCWFLAVDLDKDQWQRDAAAFIKTCQQKLYLTLLRDRDLATAPTFGFFSISQY